MAQESIHAIAVEDSPRRIAAHLAGGFPPTLYQQSDIASITYSVYDDDAGSVVSGHDGASLVVADVIFDTPLTYATVPWWPHRELEINFAHLLPASALPDPDKTYAVEYVIQPAGSPTPDPIPLPPFRIKTVSRHRG